MRRRHTLCVASAKLACDVDTSCPMRALEGEAGCRGVHCLAQDMGHAAKSIDFPDNRN